MQFSVIMFISTLFDKFHHSAILLINDKNCNTIRSRFFDNFKGFDSYFLLLFRYGIISINFLFGFYFFSYCANIMHLKYEKNSFGILIYCFAKEDYFEILSFAILKFDSQFHRTNKASLHWIFENPMRYFQFACF